MAEIINGKLVATELRKKIKEDVALFKSETSCDVGLVVIIVGENPASQVYVRNKAKACDDVGIASYVISLPVETSEEELIARIDELNNDSRDINAVADDDVGSNT